VTVRILNQMGDDVIARLAERGLDADVDVVPLAGGEPPADLRADVFFGGYGDWSATLPWLHTAGVRWVQLSGTGADRVPAEVFDGRTVTCARGASAGPIAEFVLGAILARAKRFPDIWLREPPRHWNFPIPRMDVVEGCTVGLVGLGGIGTAIAQRAVPFGMRVVALRRTDTPSPVPGVEIVRTLEDLLAVADHLVLAAPATPRTRHLLDADAFAKVKPGVHLVNIARGALVDQDALRAALDDGRVATATLDTVDPEPLPGGHWMYSHPNVRLSAHVSWYTPEMLGVAIGQFVDNVARYVAGEPLADVVDPDEGY
jgi:phosphoglycerate dehydrogenase-like enzyme